MTQIKVSYLNHMGDDLAVVNAARVSFGKVSEEFVEKDSGLIKYLATHEHFSPFGHCFLSFHVKAPIFVARQLVKHKFLRWNEISRRYVDSDPEFYVPDIWREKALNVKQGSKESGITEGVVGSAGHNYDALCFYKDLIDSDICPEQARMVLPQSTMTEWIWSGSLDAFTSMCNLRLKKDTQYETRLVAQQIDEVGKHLFPVSWEALVGKG